MTLAIRHALRTSERATRATLATQFIGRLQTAVRLSAKATIHIGSKTVQLQELIATSLPRSSVTRH